jgi:hypothetical protein|nr:MAG TPA: hypothetical protein [Caudoviricetes sp.]
MNPEIELHTDYETFTEDHTEITKQYKRNQWLYRFGDIKVSVICHMYERSIISYGDGFSPFELALIKGDELLGDPIGYLTEKKVNRILHRIDRAIKMKQAINEDFVENLGGC